MGFENRTILYNKLIEDFQKIEIGIGSIHDDLQDSLRNTDQNFPNKIEKLENQLKSIRVIEDQVNESLIELYNFRP